MSSSISCNRGYLRAMHVLLCYIVFSRYCMASGLHTSERLAMKAHFSTAIRPLVGLAAPFGLVLGLGLGISGPAHAVDGCKLLLCMAGNWQNISQCTPTVRQALRDVARGRGWPTCSMGGNNASGNQYVAREIRRAAPGSGLCGVAIRRLRSRHVDRLVRRARPRCAVSEVGPAADRAVKCNNSAPNK